MEIYWQDDVGRRVDVDRTTGTVHMIGRDGREFGRRSANSVSDTPQALRPNAVQALSALHLDTTDYEGYLALAIPRRMGEAMRAAAREMCPAAERAARRAAAKALGEIHAAMDRADRLADTDPAACITGKADARKRMAEWQVEYPEEAARMAADAARRAADHKRRMAQSWVARGLD